MVYIAETFVKKPAVHIWLITVYYKQQCNAHSTQIPIKQASAVLHFTISVETIPIKQPANSLMSTFFKLLIPYFYFTNNVFQTTWFSYSVGNMKAIILGVIFFFLLKGRVEQSISFLKYACYSLEEEYKYKSPLRLGEVQI